MAGTKHTSIHARSGQSGLSLIEVVIAVAIVSIFVWIVVSGYQRTRLAEDPAGAGPPDMVSSLDHARQQQTMTTMEQIARANDVLRAEVGRYADRLGELAAPGQRLDLDAWGRPLVYRRDGGEYTLTSLGADGAPGPAPPSPWKGAPYDPDLVMETGRFTQTPNR